MIHHWTFADRRHWTLDLGRFTVRRSCPGEPCHLPGVAAKRHTVRLIVWRRTGAARKR
jgi:hypothetical protein